MLNALLGVLRCTRCLAQPLRSSPIGVTCNICNAEYPLLCGILDMTGKGTGEVITPFQRVMQAPFIAKVYERQWRRLGYFLASSRSFDDELATVLRMTSGKDSSAILDLACGPGIFTRPLARRASGLVIGLDLSWPMLRRARRLLDADGISNVALVRASAFHLPFVDDAFSLVNCCGALHLFARPDTALDEVERVAAPGGHLTVQTTIRPMRSAGIAYILERFIRFGFFEEADLRERIARHAFEILESERHRISFTFLGRHIS